MSATYATGFECDHWGEVPPQFNELKHVLICTAKIPGGLCGGRMGRVAGHPHEAGYRDANKVEIKLREER